MKSRYTIALLADIQLITNNNICFLIIIGYANPYNGFLRIWNRVI